MSNSATADPFEIGLYDLRDDSYVLSLWAESGGFEKEGSPYCKASFGASNQLVRVVWGTSEYWNDDLFANYTANSTYKLTDTNTYTAEFPAVVHDVQTATFQVTNASTVHYTQTGPSLDTGDRDAVVDVSLTLTRVN